MEATKERTVFSPAQTVVINAVAHLHTEEEIFALKQAIAHFFFERATKEMDRLWDSGTWNEQTLEVLKTAHYRTPYTNRR
ncbi:MAG: dephospho-CoA kinase [Bacteroidaceae bacterium]|nr:dephospho-CoA kinase [Bacteroidaceae bacterium]